MAPCSAARSCRPDLSLLHLEDARQRPQPARPARVRGGHQGLAPPRHLAAQRGRPLLVQLRVEVVEERDRRGAALLAVHLERGQGQRQQQAARLAGRGELAGLLPVDASAPPRRGAGPPGCGGRGARRAGATPSRARSRARCASSPAGSPPGPRSHVVALARGREAAPGAGRRAAAPRRRPRRWRSAAPSSGSARPRPRGPGVPATQGGVALQHHALVVAQRLPVGRPERGGAAVQERAALAHGPADHAQAVGGVDHHLQPAVVRARRAPRGRPRGGGAPPRSARPPARVVPLVLAGAAAGQERAARRGGSGARVSSVRNERPRASRPTASSTLVLPCAFLPTNTFSPAPAPARPRGCSAGRATPASHPHATRAASARPVPLRAAWA